MTPREPMTATKAVTASAQPAVLVIDDSDIDREAMAEVLVNGGFTVHVLPSPIGATRVARELRVKVVVIDQNLPAMDGSKLAQLFRSNPGMRGIRVILVSGNDEQSMLEVARLAQVDAFVSKCLLHRDLVQTARRLLAESKPAPL